MTPKTITPTTLKVHLVSDSSFLAAQQSAGGSLISESSSVPRTYRFCRPSMCHFGDARREYDAAASDAVVFDVSDRVQIELSGSDAQSFVHKFCTNDVMRLAAGQGCEALVPNVKGRVVAHLFIFVTDGAVWLETTPGSEEKLLSHFDRYLFNEDVQLTGRTNEFGQLFVTGSQSGERLASLGIATPELDNLDHAIVPRESGNVVIRRADLFDGPGFLLSVDRPRLVDLWHDLLSVEIIPAGAWAFHARRIESRFPLYDFDFNEETLAQEAARTAQAISFTKGCYLGQEPIARLDALGHTNRELRGVQYSGGPLAEVGHKILDEAGKEIGVITSSATIPGSDRIVAIAMVRTRHTRPGTTVRVKCGAQVVAAKVF